MKICTLVQFGVCRQQPCFCHSPCTWTEVIPIFRRKILLRIFHIEIMFCVNCTVNHQHNLQGLQFSLYIQEELICFLQGEWTSQEGAGSFMILCFVSKKHNLVPAAVLVYQNYFLCVFQPCHNIHKHNTSSIKLTRERRKKLSSYIDHLQH